MTFSWMIRNVLNIITDGKLVPAVKAPVLPVTIILSLRIVLVEAGTTMEIKLGMVDLMLVVVVLRINFGVVIRILTERSPLLNLGFVA